MKKRLLGTLMSLCLLVSAVSPASAETIPAEPKNAVLREEIACDAPLAFTAYYATTDGKTLSELTAFDDSVNTALTAYSAGITTASTTGIPCQIFKVDTSSVTSDAVVLTLAASTVENERMALKAFNVTTDTWDTLDTAVTEGRLGAKIAVADYADENGVISAMLTPDYVTNGSNTMIWSTDPQHYTKHDDLNYMYSDIHKYMAEEYQKDAIGYVINTGDIVDDMPYQLKCAQQWKVASDAYTILDDANVPYGIVTGNHDVGDYPVNCYDFYDQYFTAERYDDNPWYGGTADDNKCHYDLVTVGNIDFMILYLGYGLEGDADVIDWANAEIAKYPHRSVIVCTHQYLRPNSLQLAGRGEDIYRYIVEPNENVVMVLSGHYDGAGYKTVTTESGRLVQQVISDYQFVQAEDPEYYEGHEDPLHKIGDTPHCNGEGYIREVTFMGDTVSMFAKSPITGGEKPFGMRDDITLKLEHPAANRSVTSYQFAAVVPNPDKGADKLEKFTLDDGSKAFAYTADGTSDVSLNVAAEENGLQALINTAKAIDTTAYTADSAAVLNDAVTAAEAALADSADNMRNAYQTLRNAVGQLEEKKDVILPEQLTLVHELDLKATAWENTNGTSNVMSPYSETKFTVNDDRSFTAEAASGEGWPQIQYTDPIVVKPENGRVYLDLDVVAGSTWSVYPRVLQDGAQKSGRINYIIEGSYDELFDAGCGEYKGVFEITQALIDLGIDVNREFTLCMDINVVPGPVTVKRIAVMTGEPKPLETAPPADDTIQSGDGDSMTTILLIVGGAIVVIGLVLFAVFYKPKKKVPATTDGEVSESEETEKTNEE